MIGITSYRDYFAKGNTRGSMKAEALQQYVHDFKKALKEDVEVVSTSDLRYGRAKLSDYTSLVSFEHPTSIIDPKKSAGFTTPNMKCHFIQLAQIIEAENVVGCLFERQSPELWMKRFQTRRKSPSPCDPLHWPSNESLWNFFDKLEENSITTEWLKVRQTRLSFTIGDSHSIMFWKPHRTVEAMYGRTLFRSLKEHLSSITPEHAEEVVFCFGNIDLRHHLARQTDPVQSAIDLATEYAKQAGSIKADVSVCELLPNIQQDRPTGLSYHYRQEPFFGDVPLRDEIRQAFNSTLEKQCALHEISLLSTPVGLICENGLLKNEVLEPKGGIHVKATYYEHRPHTDQVSFEYQWQKA